ncbi:aminoacyl-tRNA hydrolase [Fervidobacterium thailandense]|uniref:Peptidyl-tRNA hydrolase n=1 Tax=Fervidobacterium thailandense TaxID=1008305 RepID=A0A1E3G2W2_9BACT|nr:aminoacyl-tRNA hydrolase [Fervidobacterium thailandense]ODN30203.1 peptidyl-tRNA hydrolase [Fervidobacterium thailandense]
MIVVGLGNPGEKYKNTRHNVGFMFLDRLSSSWRSGPNYQYAYKKLAGTDLMLVKPMTYMNLCGEVFKFLPHDDIIVVYDDLDLPLGRLRIRKDGSAGGHNGIKSIISVIGQNFPRIRVGIGPKPKDVDAADYVLSDFTPEEFKVLDRVLQVAVDALECILTQGIDKAMSLYNSVDLTNEVER